MSWMEEQDDRECEYGYLESSAIKNLESRLSHLSAVNEKLRRALFELHERTVNFDDAGPRNEGWQSEELIRILNNAKEALDLAEEKGDL